MMQVKALAVGSLILAASVAGSSDASASRAAIAITSTPSAQTLETTVVGRIDARTHKPVAALRLGTATFKIVVTNTGDVDLAGVTVDDPAVSTCSRTIGTLAAGKSIAYVCRASNVGRNFMNSLTASGLVPDGVRTLAGATRATAATSTAVTVKAPNRRSHIPHIFRKKPKATG